MNDRFNAQQDSFDQFKVALSQLRTEVTDVSNKFTLFRKEFDEKSNIIDFLSGCQDEQVAINTEFRQKLKKLESVNSPLQNTRAALQEL